MSMCECYCGCRGKAIIVVDAASPPYQRDICGDCFQDFHDKLLVEDHPQPCPCGQHESGIRISH